VQAYDTNVIVRLVLGDDPQQAALAADIWRNSLAQGDIYLSQIVLVELAWVLAASAKLSRDRIASELHRLISIDGIVIEHESLVFEALACYQHSSADFSDCLILASARGANALPVHTFDRRFSQQADVVLVTESVRSDQE